VDGTTSNQLVKLKILLEHLQLGAWASLKLGVVSNPDSNSSPDSNNNRTSKISRTSSSNNSLDSSSNNSLDSSSNSSLASSSLASNSLASSSLASSSQDSSNSSSPSLILRKERLQGSGATKPTISEVHRLSPNLPGEWLRASLPLEDQIWEKRLKHGELD